MFEVRMTCLWKKKHESFVSASLYRPSAGKKRGTAPIYKNNSPHVTWAQAPRTDRSVAASFSRSFFFCLAASSFRSERSTRFVHLLFRVTKKFFRFFLCLSLSFLFVAPSPRLRKDSFIMRVHGLSVAKPVNYCEI